MEHIRNNTAILRIVVRIVYIGILIFHLVMLALNANGQTFLPGVSLQPKHPVVQPYAERDLVRKIYTSQIGVREKQPNSGLEVEKYLRYVNLPKGNPWCAAFVCWVYGEAGVENPRTGWSPDLFRSKRVIWERGLSRTFWEQGTKSKEQGLLKSVPCRTHSNTMEGVWAASRCACPPPAGVGSGRNFRKPATPTTGDVFGLYFPEKGRIAHVGFVDEWQNPWVITVEGNTNVFGSREGDGVYRKRRLVRSIYKVARYVG